MQEQYRTAKEMIWLSSPHTSGRELKYIEEALSKNLMLPKGDNLFGFENDIKEFVGIDNVCCVSSGTAAIHLALIALGVDQGDEVICSTFTFSASANPIVYLKATPIFVDSDLETWNMNPELLNEAIKDRLAKGKKPKAIIIVHLYGMPASMDRIMDIAQRYEIPVIEDAAEAFGSSFDGKPCGSLGDIGILSFNGNKIITTSGGGAVISRIPEHISSARFLSTQARDPYPHYEHSQVGYNYRMSNISAGIGRGQIEVLNERVKKRRENHDFYLNAISDIPGISILNEPNELYFSNFWLSTIIVDPELTGEITREHIRIKFQKLNIESRPLWKPMHLQPIFKEFPEYVDGTSEGLFEKGLCLPSSTNIKDEQRQFVADSLREVICR